jgi:dTDP-6-deoxy-L-talose 4-dehydrogenase (NAD+)
MKIAITGATGFIGQHVRNALAKTDHDVVLVVRRSEKAGEITACETIVIADLNKERTDWFELFGKPDAVLHLAWGGLPNYMDTYHFEVELPMQMKFLKALIESGLKKLVVTGTCYEYGMSSGALSEDQETDPNTPYGIAKDNLRKELFQLQQSKNFELTWARIFYPYGEGQSESSLYSQLKNAILSNQEFLMGNGRQVLDFIQVEKVASSLLSLLTSCTNLGVVNIGSGKPQTVAAFVQEQIRIFQSDLVPSFGSIPDREYESVSFWSDNSRFDSLVNLSN